MRQKFKEMIIRHESLKLKAYNCPTGHATIGVGRNLEDRGFSKVECFQLFGIITEKKRVTFEKGEPLIIGKRDLKNQGITKEEAMLLLDNDIAEFTADLASYRWFGDLIDSRKAVLVDMLFTLGAHGFSKFKKTIFYLSMRQYDQVAREMLDSTWAGQVKGRSKELAEIMESGIYDPK